jgi:hypothetical protein
VIILPLFWDSGEAKVPRKGSLKFEKWWLAIPEFRELVIKAWALEVNSSTIYSRHLTNKS